MMRPLTESKHLGILRWGLAALLLCVTCGLLLATYAGRTRPSDTVADLSIRLLWAGGVTLLVATGLEALRSGYRTLIDILRWGWVGLLGVVGGLLLTTYALEVGSGPLIRGFSIVLLWSGGAAITLAAHLKARDSGYRLLSKGMSYPVTVFTVGMTIVAVIATIEFWILTELASAGN